MTSEFIDETERKGRLPDPERYEIVEAQFVGARRARLGEPMPLDGVIAFIVPGNTFTVDGDALRALIKSSGGSVTTNLKEATVALGKSKTPLQVPCVTEQYVLDAISNWETPKIESYSK